jgi:predicted nucleotidyltransferase
VNFDRCDPRLLDIPGHVVAELLAQVEIDPDEIMLVGASCRDIIHSTLGHPVKNLRSTDDLDLGIALSDWRAFEQIERAFPAIGDSGVCFRIGGMPVDVMPFGAIETPDGIVTPGRRGESLVVFGFDDIHEKADRLTLASGVRIRIPQPAGYAALKLRAWADRSPNGTYKDAGDLAVACFWYLQSDDVDERIWARDGEVAQQYDMDAMRAAVGLLRADALGQLTSPRNADLAERCGSSDPVLFLRSFDFDGSEKWSHARDDRQALADELMRFAPARATARSS